MDKHDTTTSPPVNESLLEAPSKPKKIKQPISEATKAKRTRKPNTFLEQAFPAEYIRQGMNGTRAYLAIKPQVKVETARAEAPLILAKPSVRQAIMDMLPSDDVESKVIKDAFKAKRPDKIDWKDLHKYTELSLKLKGYLNTETKGNVNIGIIIEK